jgi:trans-aconitate methyltransferase
LGSVNVIDLGCGPGDAAVDIMCQYPDLRWIFQDLPSIVEETEKVGVRFKVVEL